MDRMIDAERNEVEKLREELASERAARRRDGWLYGFMIPMTVIATVSIGHALVRLVDGFLHSREAKVALSDITKCSTEAIMRAIDAIPAYNGNHPLEKGWGEREIPASRYRLIDNDTPVKK